MLSEEFNIEGHVVVVKKRLAEGGFGYIDLVTDSRTNAEYCVSIYSILCVVYCVSCVAGVT
jgi:hypothetical protein